MSTLSLSDTDRPAAPKKSDLKTELWAAASAAFPETAEVTVKALDTGHPKLASRKLAPQYLVRVGGLIADTYETRMVVVNDDGRSVPTMEKKPLKVPYAVSGMLPQDSAVSAVKDFVGELKSDAARIESGFPK